MTAERRPSSFLDKRLLFDEMLCETGDVVTISTPSTLSRLPAGIDCEKLRWVTVGPNPVKNLETDELGIYGTLSFGGTPTQVFLAWDDVRIIACDLCAVTNFPEPAARAEKPPAKSQAAPAVAKKVRPSHLKLVK